MLLLVVVGRIDAEGIPKTDGPIVTCCETVFAIRGEFDHADGAIVVTYETGRGDCREVW
jgi:hypothetical protein